MGAGNGNPLQCSCLENPRDGGAWWAAVYGIAQSWTRLKWLSSSSSNLDREKIFLWNFKPNSEKIDINSMEAQGKEASLAWTKPVDHLTKSTPGGTIPGTTKSLLLNKWDCTTGCTTDCITDCTIDGCTTGGCTTGYTISCPTDSTTDDCTTVQALIWDLALQLLMFRNKATLTIPSERKFCWDNFQ